MTGSGGADGQKTNQYHHPDMRMSHRNNFIWTQHPCVFAGTCARVLTYTHKHKHTPHTQLKGDGCQILTTVNNVAGRHFTF